MLNGEGCVRGGDFKWYFCAMPLFSLCKFIILAPLLIPVSLLARGFPNTMHRFSLGLEELILPRVCWNPDSFSWPLGPCRVSVAAAPFYIFILVSCFPPLLTLFQPHQPSLCFAKPFVHSVSNDLPMGNLSFRCQFHVSFLARPPLTTPPPE